MLAAAYGYSVVLNNFTSTALFVCSPASSFVACAYSPVGLCFVCTPNFLLICISHPATSIQLAPMAFRRSHAWCTRVCTRVVCVCACVCGGGGQLWDTVQTHDFSAVLEMQLHCPIWRRSTLEMCHQVCILLLSTASVAGKTIHL